MTRHCNARRNRPGLPSANGYQQRPLPRRHPAPVTYLRRDLPHGPHARSGTGPPAGQGPGPARGTGNSTGPNGRVAAHRRRDRAQGWLFGAMAALAVLAGAAAVVSWDAQYVLVRSVKHSTTVAALEAGIPDIGAVIFAALGIALALHARRAVRARLLNLACVGISLAMNAFASGQSWRDLAIWVMPAGIYALASDSLISVVRSHTIARARRTAEPLTAAEPTPMAIIGRTILWLFRLVMAPASTVTGFRRWVLGHCPVPPRKETPAAGPAAGIAPARSQPRTRPPGPTRSKALGKQARLLALAGQRHDLTVIPLASVSKIATGIASEIDLAPGTARRVLLAHVRSLRDDQDADDTSREAQA